MVAFSIAFYAFLLISMTHASPLPSRIERLNFPHIDPKEVICQLPILKKFLCPKIGSSTLNVQTSIGMARGTYVESNARRFTVKYASAARWAPSTVVSTWNLPTGTNVTALPLACPQPDVDPSTYTEDCLSMVLYVPPSLAPASNVPTLVWIHGGSFIAGSATGPGLDGSKLAIATDSIVAVVQYRLGALGFMAPNGQTNLAVNDVINSLKFLKTVVPAFGGSNSKITLAGQSSGANMIRALLATPSASSLFKSSILQSDPMNYGFLSPSTQAALQSNYNGLIGCGASDTSCQRSLSLSAILDAQVTLSGTAMSIDPAVGIAQPIRPVRDGTLITSPLDSTAAFPPVSKPILLSSVQHEAGFAIYNQFPDPIPDSWFAPVCELTLGTDRTNTIVTSPHYPPVPTVGGSPDGRAQLEVVGTDYLWKCSAWTFARNWVQHGGSAYVGLYTVGASYPGNDAVPFCTQFGNVCHQDDIQIVFGTTSNPTAAQSALTTEVQKRYKAFLSNGNPNVAGIPTWTASSTTNVNALNLGGAGEIDIGACDPGFWGQSVEYDYQVYGI